MTILTAVIIFTIGFIFGFGICARLEYLLKEKK